MSKKTMKTIKFVDLVSQYSDMTEEILESIRTAMSKSAFVGGPALASFETNLSKYQGVDHAIGCSDGTMSLVIALLSSGLNQGDSVIVPGNSFIASSNAIVHAGGRPIFVDCDPYTYLLDLNSVEEKLASGTAKFIMPVHLYGNPCPMDDLINLAEKYNASIIEDNAQGIGALYKGNKTGSFGLSSGISFYPAKNLGAFGQGGAIITNNADINAKARIFTEQGQGRQKYHHSEIGYNGRLDSIQANILNLMLNRIDIMNTRRNKVADLYSQRLPKDRLQRKTEGAYHVYHLFEYRCKNEGERDTLASRLSESNIQFGYHYPIPIHKQKAYKEYNVLSLPVAEQLAKTLISLPMHPNLSSDEVNRVCDVVNSL